MAFEYKPFINPYIGSISELMGKGDQAKAEALLRIGEIQARAAEQQGQAWGNAIQGLGNIASKTITDYNDPKLKMEKMALAQAEEDRKNEVRLGELMKRQEASTSTRVVDGAPVIASVDPRDMVSRQTLAQTPELSSRVPSTSFGKPFDVSNGGMARVGTTSPSLVSTTTSKGLYEDENGFFNYKKAHQDLINGGASPASAARVLKSGQDANTAFSAYAAQTKAFAAAKTDMFGNAANTILKALEASPTLTVQAGIQQMLPMLRRQLPEAEYASLQQQVLGMPEAEARQALNGLVEAMDAQHETKTLGRDQTLVTLTGRTVAEGPTTPPAAPSAAMQTLTRAQEDYAEGIKNGSIPSGTNFTEWLKKTPQNLTNADEALDTYARGLGYTGDNPRLQLTSAQRDIYTKNQANLTRGPEAGRFVWTKDGLVSISVGGRTTPVLDSQGKQVLPQDTAQVRNYDFSTKRVMPLLEGMAELAQRINVLDGIQAKAVGIEKKAAAKLNYDNDVAEYEALLSTFTPLWARSVGHTGVLTEADVRSARKMFPNPGDSKDLMARKIKRIEKMLDVSIPGFGNGSADITDPNFGTKSGEN